ncbi:alpha/beta hydrolase [Phaeobacter sp. 11ANDIMAR09]|uniref:alpha/beta hydrolase n=1 Tax=Phaeobacter sp. 11ANDIMAR09 TaxID=1225647 RepID=UPI0006C87F4F|nr:alpha/beta fold hydrolase [Phaeobacter sp. 11ANDIMAR09]
MVMTSPARPVAGSPAGRPSAPQPKPRRSPKWFQLVTTLLSRVSPSLASRLFAYFFTRPLRQKLPRHERDWLLQATAQPVRLSTGEEVPLYEWRGAQPPFGVRDEAPLPTILLVHGFGGRAGQLGGFAAPLVQAGYRVVAFDAPAHGAAAGNRSSLPEMMEVTLEMASRLGPLAGVVAHSNGAAALIAALTQGMRADRVALLAPMPDLETYIGRLADQLGFSQDVTARAQQRVEARYDLPFSALKASTMTDQLPLPALILHDRQDRIIPVQEAEELAQSWASARLEITEGLGHNRLLRDDSVIAAVVAHFGRPTLR